ncbi:hypothetical protein [Stratiformator vulcanicus]|uniref:Tetratricopeptide repeat protein n=1 Tax=Stratiformator vulcanicus TaxID=2527980 RepID=A0A517R2R8_9PLAN|nr:hypothetical protein [Stratiformator vulcanicus]QDT38172.1 hypothetical protein Pan189_25620 [Stratiformator vulcanicus]
MPRFQKYPSKRTSFDTLFERMLMVSAMTLLVSWGACAIADEPASALSSSVAGETAIQEAKRTAVAMNYCRSSFYRIRKYPTPQVLAEEEQRILNNLNLNGIGDEEVIKLYSSVLDEIGDVRLSAREEKVVKNHFNRTVAERLTATALQVATELAEIDYITAARIGAGSWWDVRSSQIDRDKDLFNVEKERIEAVMDKSTGFLDVFWKLARKRNIPDRWLLRNDDLDRLEHALQERDAPVRLRLLKRMEPFMECYPPYQYHVARTEQGLGKLDDACRTFERLTELGEGHFRRDEMLAASWVNLAMIREYRHDDRAVAAAEKSVAYVTDSWQVNLAAAGVLLRAGRLAKAEDAVLRNLDADLEEAQSRVALVSVIAETGDPSRIAQQLQDPQLVARVPVPVLLKCAAALGREAMPNHVASRLRGSLYGYYDLNYGRDDFVLVADKSWDLDKVLFAVAGENENSEYGRPKLHVGDQFVTVEFRKQGEVGAPLVASNTQHDFALMLKYPTGREVKLTLRDGAKEPEAENFVDRFGRKVRRPVRKTSPMWITTVGYGKSTIALAPPKRSAEAPTNDARIATAPEATPSDGMPQPIEVAAGD